MTRPRTRSEQLSAPVRIELPAVPEGLRTVRQVLRDWLPTAGLSPDKIDDVVLAVTEVCTNAIEHGYRDHVGTVSVEASHTGSSIRIVVIDHGCWQPPQPSGLRGRGLSLVRALIPEVELETGSAGTSVELRMPV
ncbi:ATP-binding protein [Nocardia cyriacigeorgica]|uniref:ATP-binding protein n=1 Tax=Nocardia cyriacigeorgica TaxID=135487 RepID=UPI00245849AB|nr:ATP-binding protein [Nocardia cyriacigeorgica]